MLSRSSIFAAQERKALTLAILVRRMKIMYIVALLSFAALAGAAYAISRHIRKNAAAAQTNPARELEMSQALDVRLTDLSRPAGSKPAAGAATGAKSASVLVESPPVDAPPVESQPRESQSGEEPPDDELPSHYRTSERGNPGPH